MAASLLSCPSFSNHGNSQACVLLNLSHLQKGFPCISICLWKQKKLYMIPTQRMMKTYALIGSINADGASQENHVSSNVSTPNDFLRPRALLDCSSSAVDFEKQLQALFDEVKTMIRVGNINDAMDLLKANHEVVKEQICSGSRGIEEAATLDVIALGYMAMGELKIVGSLLNMLDEVVDRLLDDVPLLDSVLMHMGSMYSALGKFEKSMLVYQRVIGILERRYGKNNVFIVSPLLGMAKVLGSIGRATKATDLYHRAISILESSRGAECEDLIVPLVSLGNLLIKEGRAADGECYFMRTLSIYMKLYGKCDGRVGMALCSLAHVKCAIGNVEEAIDLYKKGLQTIKDANYMALEDSMMEKMKIDLAELLHFVGRGKEGREILEECLLTTEKYKGKEHPSSVSHLLNLAASYSQSKNFVEAERLLRISLRIMMTTVAPNDQSITLPMLDLAVTLYHLNEDEEAEQLALQVLHIRERTFGTDSLPVGEALDWLACIQTRLGKADVELLDLHKRVLKIQEKEFGYESKEIMQTLKKIVYHLDRMGKKEEKFSVQKRLSVLKLKYEQMVQY